MRDIAPLLLRVATGLVFAMHGWMKIQTGLPWVTSMLEGIGFPAAAFFAVLLVAAEFGGGILLILGAFTHWAAKVLAFVALVAFLTVHMSQGFFLPMGYEFIIMLFAASVSLMVTGPGRWSVDSLMRRR